MQRSLALPNACFVSTVLAVLLATTGCTLGRRSFEPPQNPDDLNDMAFLHYLPTVPVVTVAEGARAVLLLVGSTQDWPIWEAQRSELLRRRALKESWELDPDRILDKGTLAFMLCAICDTGPSLNQRLAAITNAGDRRYALRTCTYEGLLPYGQAHEPVTGGELLSALQRAETRIKSATEHPGEYP